jgi:hypothetical protein
MPSEEAAPASSQMPAGMKTERVGLRLPGRTGRLVSKGTWLLAEQRKLPGEGNS